MKKNLTIVLTVLLMASLLFGCAAKPKEHTSTPAPAPAPTAPPTATQEEAPSKAPVDEPTEEDELPEELQQSQEVTTSNADDWTELLCAHPWQTIDDLPDGTKYVSIYTFNADGTFTDVGGWYNSELDGEFAGTYEVSEDGVLTITYTEGHDAVLSFKLGFDIETVSLTQIGEEGRFFFHEEGYTTTLSAA